MQTIVYEGIKKTAESTTIINDFLVVEAPLEINVNGNPFTVVMRTPGDDLELVRGLLYSEDIYRGIENLVLTVLENSVTNFTRINATIPKDKLGKGYLNKRSLLSVSSCGICGKQSLDDFERPNTKLANQPKINLDRLSELFSTMRLHQHTFSLTGGSHAAILFSDKYEFLTLKEDIGRHNAVDKCVGELLNSNKLKSAAFMLVSGRVSYEIITKAFLAKISTIVAVSACSSLAVDYAKEFGICLIGFSRDNNATVYSNPSGCIESTLKNLK
ncbi:formate dehydrogenase accessory sulfurtransferase FdhD [Flavobacterium cellulosilyticum]|uniref:Sulfur carrier protein FdhD n=1 Tax=Flavobacterium cellulosilyticum TaxID=2541731 RepID=A0A4R5CHN9_9FLAO|nr:formate dehydrogenase accessory sulfurtransferase FdhD [Flavobacterium cellulosilyticum]TDD99265.1 formate dehydrogenase accessory sulfurtransferase FdhD [Flavobacterium cellulosilyticum]